MEEASRITNARAIGTFFDLCLTSRLGDIGTSRVHATLNVNKELTAANGTFVTDVFGEDGTFSFSFTDTSVAERILVE